MEIEELLLGHGQNLYSMLIDGESPVRQFIDSLEEIDLKQITQLISLISEKGPPANIRKFRHLGDEIYELKTYRGVRIFSFFWSAHFAQIVDSHTRHVQAKEKGAEPRDQESCRIS